MLLSLTSTSPDATDLGFLLHKHPDRVRSVDVGFGRAHVFYPEATPERCTATLLVEVDPVGLSRSKGSKNKRSSRAPLEPYVNDRPYVASSMLSVALGRLYRSALSGSCPNRPELVTETFDLEVALPVVPVRGGSEVLRRLFEPLGYVVECTALPLDDQFPEWGTSRYFSVQLNAHTTVQAVLEHLFVLLPVLDDRKHYWIGEAEVDKLIRRGGDWLAGHPDSELITRRYLRFGGLANKALTQLADSAEDLDAPSIVDEANDEAEAAVERPISLNEQRLDAVVDAVLAAGGGRVVDLGCGEGRLLQRLRDEPKVSYLLGLDVSPVALERAERRLRIEELSERRRERLGLIQGALTYTDARIANFDVACVVEVIEHLDAERLDVFASVLFEHAAPAAVIVTTPNREYNVHFERLQATALRHRDHRFEWTRDEFGVWIAGVCERFGYTAERSEIGPGHPETGAPTQMVVFRR